MTPPPAGLDSRVEAFESACATQWPVPLDAFLPPEGDPGRAEVLCELVRVDLEQGHARGAAKPLADYRATYPELFARSDLAEAVEFEDARLRMASESAGTQVADSQPVVESAGTEVAEVRSAGDWNRTDVVGSVIAQASIGTKTEVVISGLDLDATARMEASRGPVLQPVHLVTAMPKVGDEFLGFKLTESLGEGSFGRVFLAQQKALSDRPVALKVTARPNREAQCLARFQHANIVPVLSEHRAGDFQAVCMPYFGRTTLGKVLGTLRSQKALPASGLGLVSTLKAGGADTVPELTESQTTAFTVESGNEPAPVRAMLSHLSYVDAVVWTVARLADGLAHAHERGVLHRDMKPDNVLIADDGQPMLLDFNLADESQANGAAGTLGGTVFYMSPEHLAAFLGDRSKTVDARSDLYALGLMAYEMLTGHHPYPVPKGEKNLLRAMLDARLKPAAPACPLNPALPAAIGAVIAKLIAPDPAARYQTARQLADDLDRHLSHRPLLHTQESLLSRTRKWVRRNPKALPVAGLTIAASLALVAGVAAQANARAQAKTKAAATQYAFRSELQGASVYLNGAAGDPALKAEAARRLRGALEKYGAADGSDWHSNALVRDLAPPVQQELKRNVGEAMFLLARTESDRPAEALKLSQRAEAAFGVDAPPALWHQRADLATRTADPAGATAARERAAQAASDSAQDFYLDGADFVSSGDWAKALKPLERACQLDPAHFAATFALGCCYGALQRDAEALECFRASIALQPSMAVPYVKRGRVYLARGNPEKAEQDFDTAIRLDPSRPDAHVARGGVHLTTKQFAKAVADFDEAERLGGTNSRLRLLRSQARQALGDKSGAARDLAAGLAAPAVNDTDHAARGHALIATNPTQALAEFDAALELNPQSLVGLHNKAYVLDEPLKRPAEALVVMSRAIELYPRHVPTLAGRAVNLARAGRRADAHRDALACLKLDTAPMTLYQLACVYALTAKTEPADRREAMRLLSAALTAGFADFATVDADPDLATLRNSKEFASVVRDFRVRATARRGPD